MGRNGKRNRGRIQYWCDGMARKRFLIVTEDGQIELGSGAMRGERDVVGFFMGLLVCKEVVRTYKNRNWRKACWAVCVLFFLVLLFGGLYYS